MKTITGEKVTKIIKLAYVGIVFVYSLTLFNVINCKSILDALAQRISHIDVRRTSAILVK